MSERYKFSLYKTKTPKRIVAQENVIEGELALNMSSESPILMFKNDKNEIEKIGSLSSVVGSSEYKTMTQKTITEELDKKANNILPLTYENVEYPLIDGVIFNSNKQGDNIFLAINNVDKNIKILTDEVIDNEKVIASSLTNINDSCGFNLNGNFEPKGNYISNSDTVTNAITILDGEIKNNNNIISNTVNSVNINTESINKLTNSLKSTNNKLNSLDTKVSSKESIWDNKADSVIPSTYEESVYPTLDNILFNAVKINDDLYQSINKIDKNVKILVDESIKNEEVITNSLTTLNNSCGFNKNGEYVGEGNYINTALSLGDALTILDEEIFNAENLLNGKLDASIYNKDKPTFALKTDLTSLATKAEIADMETKTNASKAYQPIGDYALKTDLTSLATKIELNSSIEGLNTKIEGLNTKIKELNDSIVNFKNNNLQIVTKEEYDQMHKAGTLNDKTLYVIS